MEPFPRRPATRPVVGSYSSYADARQATEHLVDHGLPPGATSITVHGMRLVPAANLARRPRWVLLLGLALGAAAGFLAVLLAAAAVGGWPLPPRLALAVAGAVAGAAGGVAVALGTAALLARWRRRTSPMILEVDRFDLVTERELADLARRLLAGRRRPRDFEER